MKGLKWQKFVSGVMAGVMTFSILGTTLAVPAYAASYNSSRSEREHRQDVHKEMHRHERDRYERERREKWEREHRKRSSHDRYREAREREKAAEERRKHDEKVQRNQKIAAAAIGAIIGAVIAKNT
ncbi:hypothetical protein [Selenomonas ruminantium]|uniref:hypothetical protein n=1 Tax=Selenomonas ruminantium TaxID=971 RepID=UPI0026F00D0B|nr:hypothetical protein [Selenomonas ruminantium]